MPLPDRLTCEETFRRLDDYLDRELEPRELELVRRHLETCAYCAEEYAFEAGVIAAVREKLRRVQVPESLMARISRSLASLEAAG